MERIGRAKIRQSPIYIAYMVGPAKAEDLDRVLDHPRLQSKLQFNAADFRRPGGPGVTALPATYDFRELHTWRDQISSAVFDLPGIVFIDINEMQNRLTLGIDPELSEDANGFQSTVQAQLDDMGIPADVVVMEEVKIVLHSHTVQGSFANPEKVPGGVEIDIVGEEICTMTANILSGVWFFMTAGHCAGTIDLNDGKTMTQPGFGPQIGIEWFAPPGHFGAPNCPPGMSCRFSDAVLARHSNLGPLPGTSFTVDFGKIANAITHSITIDHSKPRWTITSKLSWPMMGTKVKKVGRTTGKTGGMVSLTCMNFTAVPDLIADVLACQNRATYTSAVGDSGSPVFKKLSSTTVQFAGIHWGGDGTNSYFSPLGGMEFDFGPLGL